MISHIFQYQWHPQSSLEEDAPGMGGFICKDLWLSPEGSLIDYFNGQFYGDFSLESFETCVKNGYPADKIVIGMLSGEDFSNCITELVKIKNKYPIFVEFLIGNILILHLKIQL